MKKILLTIALILGLSMGTYAQNSSLVANADKYASELAKDLNSLMVGDLSQEAYMEECETLGYELGNYISTLSSADDIKVFFDLFYKSAHEKIVSYGIDELIADALIESIQESLVKEVSKLLGVAGQPSEDSEEDSVEASVEASEEDIKTNADTFARKLIGLIEKILTDNAVDEKALNDLGIEIGLYIGGLSKSDTIKFRDEFYSRLDFYAARIESIDYDTYIWMQDFYRQNFNPAFESIL